MSDWTPPTEFYTVQLTTGTVIHVDDGTRREIEAWIEVGVASTLTVDDIFGSTELLIRGHVVTIWSSTVEQRARDREQRKMLRDEVPIEEREE
jgi:hypothetical protein